MRKIVLSLLLTLGCLTLGSAQWTANGIDIFNNNTGNVGIGTSTPATRLEVVGTGSSAYSFNLKNNTTNIFSIYSSDNASGAHTGLFSYRSRGTTSAPIDLLSGDRVSVFSGQAYLGGAYRGVASIQMYVGAGASSTSYPGYIMFSTVPTGSTTGFERMRIAESGFVGIGKTNPSYMLDVNGTINATDIYLNGQPFSGGSSQWTTSGSNIYYNTGNIGIGTSTPGSYKLNVWGSLRAHEIVVNTTGADFVFDSTYKLRPLEEVEKFINEHKHLPEIPSAQQMQEEGMKMADTQTKLLQKIEELTLYVIELKKEVEKIKKVNEELKSK